MRAYLGLIQKILDTNTMAEAAWRSLVLSGYAVKGAE